MTTTLDPAQSLAAVCCTPLLREPLSATEAERLAAVFKAIADPARLRLLSLIAAHDGAEACVCDLTDPLELSQPTVSHHLKVLVDVGLLSRDKRGKWSYYALVPGALEAVGTVLLSHEVAASDAGTDRSLEPSRCS